MEPKRILPGIKKGSSMEPFWVLDSTFFSKSVGLIVSEGTMLSIEDIFNGALGSRCIFRGNL